MNQIDRICEEMKLLNDALHENVSHVTTSVLDDGAWVMKIHVKNEELDTQIRERQRDANYRFMEAVFMGDI